jgi:hypothetical protein
MNTHPLHTPRFTHAESSKVSKLLFLLKHSGMPSGIEGSTTYTGDVIKALIVNIWHREVWQMNRWEKLVGREGVSVIGDGFLVEKS